MSNKKKSKKEKKPNIPVQTTVRPRLEQILSRRQHGELDDEEYITSIEKLMAEVGREPVLDTLVGLLDKVSNEQRDALMVALPKLGNQQTIDHLWQLVRRSKLSVSGKMTALVILKQMGEDVNLNDPSEYFSWRDIKNADVAEVQDLARFGARALIKELQKLTSTDEVEAMMMRFAEITGATGGIQTMQSIVADLIQMADPGAADMLTAIAATTPHRQVREAARTGLLKLSGQKVFPQSEVIKSLTQERFYAAYSTDPAHPWQQGVLIAWERSANAIQGLMFLRDFGHPWKGSIKDMFVTMNMTPHQFQREFIDRVDPMGVEYRRVTYARARQFILDALAANERQRVKLPPEYDQFRHLIERRIVDPSPELLAYAAQVDAKTTDEWGELKGEPVRGIEVIGPGGQVIPLINMEDLDEAELIEAEPQDLNELLDEVEEFYYLDEEDETGESILPYDWTVDYLTTRYDEGVDLAELYTRWLDLSDFILYLEESNEDPLELADLQGVDLSYFVTDFWDETVTEETSVADRQHAVETVRDLYTYLAGQEYLPPEAAARVDEAAKTLLSHPDRLTPIEE